MRRYYFYFFFAASFLLLPARAAAADTATSALSWVRLPGAESCISTPDLGARIEKHLGRSVLVSPSTADISIEGRIQRAGTGGVFKATVGGTRHDGTPIGSRDLTSASADCRSIDDGLVLVIALMIDPNAMSPAPAPAPTPPPPPVETTHEVIHERIIVRDVEHLPAGPAPTTPPPWIAEASIGGAASIERAPGVSPSATVAARVGPSRLLAFEVLFGVLPNAELTIGSSGARTVDYTILEGGLAYCPTYAMTPSSGRMDLGGCAGFRAGLMRSSGRGFTKNEDVDRGLFDLAVGPRFEARLFGPVFALLNATALVPLVRQETTVRGTTAAGSAAGSTTSASLDKRSALGGEIGIGLGLRFSP